MPIPEFRTDGWLPVGHHIATWEEVDKLFGGNAGSRRANLTRKLLDLCNALRSLNITGKLVLDGSYISSKPEPGDFDVLLIGPPDIQARKDIESELAHLLDAERAEKEGGYTLYYASSQSPMLPLLYTLFDFSKENVPKGVLEVNI